MKIKLYNQNKEYIKTFESRQECAEYFDKFPEYISHNLKYCKRIRKDDKWYYLEKVITNKWELLKEWAKINSQETLKKMKELEEKYE